MAKMNSPPQVINTLKKKTEDETFAELISTMLEDILTSYEKLNLMTFQGEINKLKYKGNNQVALLHGYTNYWNTNF